MPLCSSLTAASANVKNALQIGKACMDGYENKLPQGFYNKISSYVVIRDAPMKGSNTGAITTRSFVCDLVTTVLYINVQFVQPVCCCFVQGKKVTIALCVAAEVYNMFCRLLGFTTAACCIFAKSNLLHHVSKATMACL